MKFLRTLQSRKGKLVNLSQLEPGIGRLCQKFGLNIFYLFGSYASGKADILSDIDIAYLPGKRVDTLKLLEELQTIFEEEAIDLVDLRTAPPALTHRVLKNGKCLYAKDLRTKILFEMGKENEYYDTAYLRRIHLNKMLERIKNDTFGLR